MNNQDSIRDDGQPNKYFHIVLNMADDDLNPYQYRLLGHYRRVCGDGGMCWEGTRTTAAKCKMSVGKVSSTRKELEQLGYISIEAKENETLHITLIDRMAENVLRYAKRSPDEHPVHQMNTPVHGVNERITLELEPIKKEKEPRKRVVSPATPKTKKQKAIANLGDYGCAIVESIVKLLNPETYGMYSGVVEYLNGKSTAEVEKYLDEVEALQVKPTFVFQKIPAVFARIQSHYQQQGWTVSFSSVVTKWDDFVNSSGNKSMTPDEQRRYNAVIAGIRPRSNGGEQS